MLRRRRQAPVAPQEAPEASGAAPSQGKGESGPKRCPRGDLLTPETTYVDRAGKEHCRVCWSKGILD